MSFAVIAGLAYVSAVRAADGPLRVAELKAMTLEELSNVIVTSVSRTAEPVREVASAVHVITGDDIRRSGVRSIPEALRLAPNLQVAQASARSWAISARGFNAPFANKLLVLIDGRSVYSPLFSGVFWDAQDTLLEDVERIEVISGPGATVWGANAVNGVINIITKRANDTQGALLTVGAGTEERLLGALRYGGRAGDALHYRVYAKYFDRGDSVLEDGSGGEDAWYSGRAGFRMDWARDERDVFTVTADAYGGHGDQIAGSSLSQSGGHVLGRWTRKLTDMDELRVQMYYDRTHQFAPGDFGDDLDTFDVDAQYGQHLGERHHLIVGVGYRHTRDRVDNLPDSIAFLPAELDQHLFSAFVQDSIALMDDAAKLTLGAKLEHNDYTGLEVQPSVRASWTIGQDVIWGAVSRAVRTPSRFDRDLFFPAEPPFVFAGGPAFDSEKVIAYELGWRHNPLDRLLGSLAVFYNDYDDIRSTSLGPPFVTENNVEGEIYGLELSATLQVTADWRVLAGYTLLREDLRVKAGRVDLNAGQGETFDPQHQAQVRSSWNLLQAFELDAWLRYVDQIGATGRGFDVVPDFVTLDVRIGWSPATNLQLAIVGQNLLEERHREFGVREIERSVYGKITWRF